MNIHIVIFSISLVFGISANATSIQYVSIGVNCLTCSMCTRSVEMSIRRLGFVDSVAMDLENTDGKIFLKPNSSPDFKAIAKAITNAGFSVRFMRFSVLDFARADACFTIGENQFQWIGDGSPMPGMELELELVGEEFMPRKNVNTFRNKLKMICTSEKPVYYVKGK